MSWSSRLPSFGGRWSPFSASDSRNQKPSQPIQVQESDYSYISPDDIDAPKITTTSNATPSRPSHSSSPTSTSTAPASTMKPPRETDAITFRHGKTRHTVHFPQSSFSLGSVSISDIRAAAARKLDVADPRRVRMFFKGRNLKDDRAACRSEGLTSDVDAEILCVIADAGAPGLGAGGSGGGGDAAAAGQGALADGESDSGDDVAAGADGDADGDEDGDGVGAGGGSTAAPKRKRVRNKKKKGNHGRKNAASTSNANSGTSSPLPPSTPLTPLAKLEAIATVFRTTLLPQCVSFTASPAEDRVKRAFDHKRLTETILAQVLLKLDAVETEGEEGARVRRRELVREVQGWLGRLDEVGASAT